MSRRAFEHDFIFLRTTDGRGQSYGGFQWPTTPGEVVVAPDWNADAVCGGGLHGLRNGLGNWGLLAPPASMDSLWYVCGGRLDEMVEIDEAMIKVPRCRVLSVGPLSVAMQMISPHLSSAVLERVEQRTKAATPEGEQATGPRGASSATGYGGASSATGDGGASSATGPGGASSATGPRGASSATGDGGASSATGYGGVSSATGDGGVSSATGDGGASSATGPAGVALAAGYECRGMVESGSLLVLVERDRKTLEITHYFAAKEGERGIQAGRWYLLRDGKVVDVEGQPNA